MERLRHLLAVAVIAAALPSTPAFASAATVCTLADDPAGDVSGPTTGLEPAPDLVRSSSASAADIRRLSMGHDGTDLVVALAVAEIATAPETDDYYDVSWRVGSLSVWVDAARTGTRWSFSRTVSSDDGRVSSYAPIAGSADASSGEISFRVPHGDAANASDGALLQQVWASATHTDAMLFFKGSFWGDSLSAQDTRLTSDCADAGVAPELCSVIEDTANDVSTSLPEKQDAQVDFRSIEFGVTGQTLTVRLTLGALAATPGRGFDHDNWSINWKVGRASYATQVLRTTNGTAEFYWYSPTASGRGSGVFDVAARTITMLFDRASLGATDGALVRDIYAWSGSGSTPTFTTQSDAAPDSTTPGRWVAGVSCSSQVQHCPPVIDAPDDAGSIVFTSALGNLPKSEAALDLLSVGGRSDAAVVTVSAKVADLTDPLSAGWDVAGWTISWSRTDHDRYFAQAVRTATGTRFTFGIDPSNGEDYATGAIFGGATTTGVLDGTTDTVSIDVPRDAIGSPADGTTLDGFAATSWAMRSGNSAAAFHVFDQAGRGRYPVGTDCWA